jgi:amino acid adenylation domain-containing protein
MNLNQLTYWKQQLKNAPSVLELPVDYPRPPVQSFRGAKQFLELPKSLNSALKLLSQQEGVSLFMTLLAAFQTLLYRYTDQPNIVVGSPIANRNRTETYPLIGLFVNYLALHTNLSGNPTFLELLEQVREMTLEAYAHQDLPFEKLLEELQPQRSLSYSPLFQVMFVLQNAPIGKLELPGLSIAPVEVENVNAKFDLTLAITETESGLHCRWEYNTDLFDAATIERMAGHFQILLEGIIANPKQRVAQLPLLSAAERHQLLLEWNDTKAEFPSDKCIHELFEQQVEQTPDAVAVVYENQQLTYQQLNCRANQLAHYLRSLGVGPEVLVGIYVERSLDMVVGLLGILKAGGAYVPLDPAYPTDRLSFMLKDAQVSVLLTQRHLVEKLFEPQARVVCLDTDWEAMLRSVCSKGFDFSESAVSGVKPNNLAYVIYTSGSTGQPKGVAIEHHSTVALLNWATQVFAPKHLAGVLASTSICFDLSVFELFVTLSWGGKVILAENALHLPTLPSAEEVTLLNTVPSAIAELLKIEAIPSSVQIVNLAGEPLQNRLVQQLYQRDTVQQVFNLYGPSEDTTYSTLALVKKGGSNVTIGRPIANTQIYILDSHLQPVPIGVPGELHIGGAGLARGYLNRQELTQEKFISNPFSDDPHSRLYKTGDLVRYLPDGNIEYLGRIDNQIKIRGFRIELGEIETTLSQHEDVQANCVIAREDTPGDKRLVAYVVANKDSTPTIQQLRQFLTAKLPEYMVPSTFVMLAEMPLTPNGKVDRRALRAPDVQSEITQTYVAPRTPVEEILAQLWSQVLKLKRVGITDNFFELGGHSLLATQLVSRIRTTFKIELPLRRLFAAATVAQLAQEIQQQQQQLELTVPPLLPTPRNAHLPLSFAQSRLWFLDQLKPNSAFYNIPAALRLQGQLQVTALQQSLREIIHRHSALRTNFITVDGQPVQIIHTETAWALSIVDGKDLPRGKQEIASQQLASSLAQQPFDLANEPLFRATLVVLSETEHILLMCTHHIVSDGWSMGVFVQELATLYNAYSQGQPSPLAPLVVQYADFAVWQRQWLAGEVLQTQLAYWQKQLADAPALLSLPTDRPRPPVQTFSGAHLTFGLSCELTLALTQLSQQQGVTLFMTLLAAFDVLLYRYTDTEDILVGSAIANRNRSEIEGLIGFFVNTLVMRTDVSGNPSFAELLARVRELAIDAYAHQDLPFEMLVEALQPERSLSHTPLFQVMFVLQNAPRTQIELTGLSVSSLPAQSATAKFDLTLVMENTADGLVGVWEYNTDLFDDSTIERMAGHFQTLLEGIVANSIGQISQLPLLSEVEQQQLLVEWNDTTVDYPTDKCIHQLFEEQVQRTPDAVAVVYENQQLTYYQLNCRANQLAHYLQSLGVGADVLVGICVERSLDMVVGLLGILKAGGAYVPLDPEYPQERLSFMLEDTQLSVILTQEKLVDKLPNRKADVICLDSNDIINQQTKYNSTTSTKADNLAYVMYTSGSTGQPKGVAVHHRAVNRLVINTNYIDIKATDVIAQASNYAFDAATFEIWGALLHGARLVGVSKDLVLSPQDFAAFMRSQGISVLFLTTALFNQIAQEVPSAFNSLRHILFGGEAVDPKWVKEVLKNGVPQRLLHVYGPTENTTFSSWYLVQDVPEDATTIPIGRAIANTQVYILDKNLQPVPVGVPGELHIGGAGLAQGYLNRPQLTAEKFIPNPFSSEPNSRLYKTGDKGRYLANGNIEYLGRIDNQVKIRGLRIELGEIEAVLSQHPSVHSVVVIARVDTRGDRHLVAYIVPQQHIALTISDLRQFLKTKLPNYMVPQAIVMLESLPLTPNGKVDSKALPAPNFQQALSATYVAPQTELEQTIARVWQQVLHREKVGIHDNFFDLGGHSLLIAQVQSQLEQLLSKKVLIVKLFQYPTINSLANYLTEWPAENTAFEQSHQRVSQQKEAIHRHKQRRQRQKQK